MGAKDTIKDVSREKLISDLKLVVTDAEELLRATAAQAGEKATVARERIQASLASAKQQLDDTRLEMLERGNEFGTVTGRKRRCGWFDAVLVRQACAMRCWRSCASRV